MLYNPDEFDAVIVIFKFLTVFSCGLLSGEALFLSKAPGKCVLAMLNADKISLRVFRLSGTTANLHMLLWLTSSLVVPICEYLLYLVKQYRLNLLSIFAGLGVFFLEVRDRHYWLYGTLGVFIVLLYTKFYLCPRIINHLTEPEFVRKGESHTNLMILKFQQRHHGRTLLSCVTFVWFIYSLYVS